MKDEIIILILIGVLLLLVNFAYSIHRTVKRNRRYKIMLDHESEKLKQIIERERRFKALLSKATQSS